MGKTGKKQVEEKIRGKKWVRRIKHRCNRKQKRYKKWVRQVIKHVEQEINQVKSG